MKLIILRAANLRNTNFIKEFIHYYKPGQRSVVVHEGFGSIADTRFVTKRLSSLMSDKLVVNNAFSGDQREILTLQGAECIVRKDLLQKSLDTVDLLVLNAIVLGYPMEGEGEEMQPTFHSVTSVATAIRRTFEFEETILFPDNYLSPLAADRPLIMEEAQHDRLKGIYDEEFRVLAAALAMRPAVIAAPGNFIPA